MLKEGDHRCPSTKPQRPTGSCFKPCYHSGRSATCARLCDEYAAILTSSKRGSDAFWEIEKRIKEDRKRPGVLVRMEKKEMPYIILDLIRDKAITLDDLEGFSDGLKERLDDLIEFWNR